MENKKLALVVLCIRVKLKNTQALYKASWWWFQDRMKVELNQLKFQKLDIGEIHV